MAENFKKIHKKTPKPSNERKNKQIAIPVPELCREHGMSSARFYKWSSKFGGMDASLMARMRKLEQENVRHKRMYADAQLRADVVREALAKK